MQQRFSFLAQQFRQFGQPVAILDLEATGGDLNRDRITEIAYLRFDGENVKAVQHLVNPETPISDFIANLTGIDNDMVAHAPVFADLVDDVLADLRGCILVAHNSQFDYTLLVNECAYAGRDFAAAALCTVKLSKKLYPNEHKHNLDAIAARFQLQAQGGRHRAMTDVILLADFLQQSARDLGDVWTKTALSLMYPAQAPLGLPETLLADLAYLGDGCGVAHWLGNSGETLAVCAYERGFVDAVADLKTRRIRDAHGVRWTAAIGALDALMMCVDAEGAGLPVLRSNSLNRFTLAFVARSGCLKAEIVPVHCGVFPSLPYGIFLHPKAAQKALQNWAKKEGICLTMLGVNPHKLPENAPCPALQAQSCSAACHANDVALHNEAVRAALQRVPFGDWSWHYAISVTEQDKWSPQQKTFICERGALRVGDELWYWGSDLLDCMKRKYKESPQEIRTISWNGNLQVALSHMQKVRK